MAFDQVFHRYFADTSRLAHLLTGSNQSSEDIAQEAFSRTYDYQLYDQCGVHWARIDGTWWETAPLDDGNPTPPPGWGNPRHDGTLTIIDATTADYTSSSGVTIRFIHTDAIDPPILCD